MNRLVLAIVLLLGSTALAGAAAETRTQEGDETPPRASARPALATSLPYAPRTLQGSATAMLFKWMGPGRQADDEESIREEPLSKAELWEAPTARVIQALWDARRPVTASREATLRFEPVEPPAVPEAGTAVARRRYSSCSGVQTLRWQLVWSPREAWVICGGEEDEREDRSFLDGVGEPMNPIFARELSAAQGRRLAGLLLTLGTAQASGVPPMPDADGSRAIVLFSAHGELVVRSTNDKPALYDQRADLTDLVLSGGAGWKGAWKEEMALCVAPALFDTALEPLPPHRDRAGVARAALRQAAAWAFARELAEPDSVPPCLLATAATSAGQEGWVELRTAVAELATRHGELSEWERQASARAAGIQRLTEALHARKEPGLTSEVIQSDAAIETLDAAEEAEDRDPAPRFSPKATKDLAALRQLRAERREAEQVSELNDREESGRARMVLRRALSTAARRMDAWNDRRALVAWATEGSAWAYRRLRAVDPAEADAFLRAEFAKASSAGERARFLKALERTAPEAARQFDAELPPQGSRGTADALPAEAAPPVPAEELLRRVRDRELESYERVRALRDLTGQNDKRLQPGGEFDRALVEVLRDESRSNDGLRSPLVGELAEVLARHGAEHWELIAEVAAKPLLLAHRDCVRIVERLVAKDAPSARRIESCLPALLRSRLAQAGADRKELIWLAWTTDARELRDVIASLGTFSPEDRESPEAEAEETAPPARFHLARQVASLWDEPDPGARLRLLAAFAFRNANRFAEKDGPPARRLAAEWKRSAAKLASAEAKAVEETVRGLDAAELGEFRNRDESVDAVLRLLTELGAGRGNR